MSNTGWHRFSPAVCMYEIQGVTEDQAREAFRLASAKLAVGTTFVKRSVL